MLERQSNEELLRKVIKPLKQCFKRNGLWDTSEIDTIALQTQRKMFPSVIAFENAVETMIGVHNSQRLRVDLREAFRRAMTQLRAGFERKNRHFLLTPAGKRLQLERSLRPTQATLVIVPMALLEHWYEQFQRHVDPRKLSPESDQGHQIGGANPGSGVIWIDGWGDLTTIRPPLAEPKIDQTRPAITSERMASYMVVVTTFERCMMEYDYESSPFKELRWLRLVVDEGHELGGGRHDATDDDHKFIQTIAAERRWVMTGTPTVGTCPIKQLRQLHSLLRFLRHPKYGTPASEEAWESDVVEPYSQGLEAAPQRVLSLLEGMMVRHTKKHLELKEPEFKRYSEVLPPEESVVGGCYNQYKQAYMANLETEKSARRHEMSRQGYEYWLANKGGQIATDMYDARDGYHKALHIIQVLKTHKRPKALVFAEEWHDLNYTAHWLTVLKGDDAIAQHHGKLRSAALQAFRHDFKHVIQCPRCGNFEEITGQKNPRCTRTFLKVQYLDFILGNEESGVTFDQYDNHNRKERDQAKHPHKVPRGQLLVPEDRVRGLMMGRKWIHDDDKLGIKGEEVDLIEVTGDENNKCFPWQEEAASDEEEDYSGGEEEIIAEAASVSRESPPRRRRVAPAGRVRVMMFATCSGFHGHSLVGYDISKEKKKIRCEAMLLEKDGSHGLDLPFSTHIFLLPKRFDRTSLSRAKWEPITDPAMINQVVARSHRIGHATTQPCDKNRCPVIVESVAFHHDTERKRQAEQEAPDMAAVWRQAVYSPMKEGTRHPMKQEAVSDVLEGSSALAPILLEDGEDEVVLPSNLVDERPPKKRTIRFKDEEEEALELPGEEAEEASKEEEFDWSLL